jgi:hypothetical protein
VRARAPERFATAVEIEAGQQEQVEIATRLLQAAGAATFV